MAYYLERLFESWCFTLTIIFIAMILFYIVLIIRFLVSIRDIGVLLYSYLEIE